MKASSWCKVGWHSWLRWTRPVESHNVGYKVQWRECDDCGLVEHRLVWWDRKCNLNEVIAELDHVKKGQDNDGPITS